MSDFQKQTLKRYGRNFLILCGVALLCYGGVKFELVQYAALADNAGSIQKDLLLTPHGLKQRKKKTN